MRTVTSAQPSSPRPLALTMGDPAGIGPELAIKAWLARETESLPPWVWVGPPEVLTAAALTLGQPIPIACLQPSELAGADWLKLVQRSLPVVALAAMGPVQAGRPDTRHAPSIIASIERAVALVTTGAASALVTNPIAKAPLYEAGFKFPGHTEYLAHLSAAPGQAAPRPVMLLAGPHLRVVPLTIHVPLADVPRLISHELIVETALIMAASLARDFGIPRPRIAVAGLNPHAGEGGSIGREDLEIVAPAVAQLRAQGLDITGPHPADTMFHAPARAKYDAALCMYHDQALIPLKTLAFEDGVNVTLGLPFVRTSPDHGTAFDIAGLGQASPRSLIAAIRLADQMAARRRAGGTEAPS